ncbi:MAG: hypothetical protein ABJA78_03465 [Ferruginibacter sp.]
METLHLIGHNHNWNLDSYFQNSIGDGFIFTAFSFDSNYFQEKDEINGHKVKSIFEKAFFDLQYFGKKQSGGLQKGKLETYPFHPAARFKDDTQTEVMLFDAIKAGVKYQESLGLTRIIIPNYYETDDIERFFQVTKEINKWIAKNRKTSSQYFLTIPVSSTTITNNEKVEKLLFHLTDLNIVFDGYYIVCETKPETKQKLTLNFDYLFNVSKILKILKLQKFITIYSYANWDAILFLALTDIDYISIATFENLRNFNISRFISTEEGGPSKGWYFSEKLLNFVKYQLLALVRRLNGMDFIRNDRNIFSDTILESDYSWSNINPRVHKNYLLSVDRLLKEVSNISIDTRKDYVLRKIDNSIKTYDELERMGIYLTEESKNYHLETWRSFLLGSK